MDEKVEEQKKEVATKEHSVVATSKDVNTQPVGNVVHALNSINLFRPSSIREC